MLNHIVIMGRLTRDPELRRTSTGRAVAAFSVAVERDFPNKETGEREVDFINCVAWQQTGEFVSKWFAKGSMIVVSGRLQMRNWTDKDGNKRTTAEIVADDVYFGEGKKDRDAREANRSYTTATYNTPSYGGFTTTDFVPLPPRFDTGLRPSVDYAMLDDDDAVLPF